MKDKHIWRVTAYSFHPIPHFTDGDQTDGAYEVYDHYFTNYDEAKATHMTGELTMGIRYGLNWHLSRIAVDTMYSQQDIDDLAAALTKELP